MNKVKKHTVTIMSTALTSESAPLSAPGHLKVTYSWHRLCTTNEHTANIVSSLKFESHVHCTT